MAYLDTSILGSYYCPEILSDAVERELVKLSGAIISPLVEMEFCSLLAIKIRTKAFNQRMAEEVLSEFQLDLADGLYQIVDVGAREYHLARHWLAGFKTSLRTLDALHLATAASHQQEIVTTDKIMAESAKRLETRYRLIR